MKLTNKEKAQLRKIAPQCANRLADKMWDILDLYEIMDELRHNFHLLEPKEMCDWYSQVEGYLTAQIGKNL